MITRFALGNRYPIKKLGDLVQFLDNMRRPVTEADRNPGPYPYYGANGQQGVIDSYLFDEPLVLLAEDGGHFDSPERGIAYRISGKTWVNNHAHVLRPRPEVSIDYLCRVLENYDVKPWVTGTTRGKLTKAGASEIEVPLPPLTEQRRIAAILDKADALRAKRREAIAKLDQLLQSVFLDMFGDPVTNPKGWPKRGLTEAYELTNGRAFKSSEWSTTGLPIIRIQNVRRRDEPFNYFQGTFDDRHLARKGDILMCWAGQLVSIGVHRWDREDGLINQHIFKVVPKFDAEINFAAFMLGLVIEKAKTNFRGIEMKHLTKSDLSRETVIVPPIKLQREFAAVARNLADARMRLARSGSGIEGLFAAVRQNSFSSS